MEIQIIEATDKSYPLVGRRYFTAHARCGKHEATVMISNALPGALACEGAQGTEVRVVVHNASNRAWKGIGGRVFGDAVAAVAAYKTAEIRQIIMAVVNAALPVPTTH